MLQTSCEGHFQVFILGQIDDHLSCTIIIFSMCQISSLKVKLSLHPFYWTHRSYSKDFRAGDPILRKTWILLSPEEQASGSQSLSIKSSLLGSLHRLAHAMEAGFTEWARERPRDQGKSE